MKNSTFATCPVERRQRKLTSYLRQMSDNRLTMHQMFDLMSSVSFDLQYLTYIHCNHDTFIRAIENLALVDITVVFGEIMPGNALHPPYLLNPQREVAIVANTPDHPAIYLYLPNQA